MPPRVLLLSAYAARSHSLWSERLQGLFPAYRWTRLSLPPRHFNWTIRGNSLLWAFGQRQLLEQPFDLLVATSMVDLSSLRGFVPALAKVPTVMYFHENQFVYPTANTPENTSAGTTNIEPVLVPLYGALAADRIVFNSQYNRDTFIQGTQRLFRKLPDTIPDTAMTHLLASQVIPVPIPAPTPVSDSEPVPVTDTPRQPVDNLLEVVWNHRWEYDKGIDLLLAVCHQIASHGLPVRMHIAGEQFRQWPSAFEEIDKLLDTHAGQLGMARGQFGFMPSRQHYDALLARCDVVLSTALHDFQGLAIQEACVAGCTPLAPNDLVYPEYLDSGFLYARQANVSESAQEICQRLLAWQGDKVTSTALPKAPLTDYREESLKPRYDALFTELMQGK